MVDLIDEMVNCGYALCVRVQLLQSVNMLFFLSWPLFTDMHFWDFAVLGEMGPHSVVVCRAEPQESFEKMSTQTKWRQDTAEWGAINAVRERVMNEKKRD